MFGGDDSDNDFVSCGEEDDEESPVQSQQQPNLSSSKSVKSPKKSPSNDLEDARMVEEAQSGAFIDENDDDDNESEDDEDDSDRVDSRLSRGSQSAMACVNFLGIKEGNSYQYDFEKIDFKFAQQNIDMYSDRYGEEVCFEHFKKSKKDGTNSPRGYGFLDRVLVKNLKDHNIIAMRPVQLASFMATFFNAPEIKKLSNGKNDEIIARPDFIGISETGSGKTVAFLVPIIQKCLDKHESNLRYSKPTALIFACSTLLAVNIYQRAIELTKDTKIKVQLICGGKSFLRDAEFDIGICTIGRYKTHSQHQRNNNRNVKIDVQNLDFLVIDEADKMTDDSDNRIILEDIRKEAFNCSTMLFSATHGPGLSSFYDETNSYEFQYGSKFNAVAESITQIFWPVNSQTCSMVYGSANGQINIENMKPPYHPFDTIYMHFKDQRDKKLKKEKKYLIFVKRTIVADIVAQRLKLYGFNAIAIHGKHEKDKREQYLKEFIDGNVNILVGTNLLTRGIDVPADIVFNYDLPLDYRDYVHRCGRVGRSKNKGQAITLVDTKNWADYNPITLRQILLKIPAEKIPDFLEHFVELQVENDAEAERQLQPMVDAYNED